MKQVLRRKNPRNAVWLRGLLLIEFIPDSGDCFVM